VRGVQSLRGRWSSLDGVTAFGWSGSAFLGGALIDHAGFHTVFLVTAAVQLASTAFLLPLLCAVPRRESELQHAALAPEPRGHAPVRSSKEVTCHDVPRAPQRMSSDGEW
jgi:hypothetical protein